MKKDLFKNCKTQYAYDNKDKIYTVMVMLDNRPRILTFRVGEKYTEISIANKNGDILEVLRQEGGNITLNMVK
ncbi:hypothetical protein H0O02_01100 [Candidatus Micrarchaeota archaeon]|nr:hypothetical protein [Candidatus Micrarchaeota archaeon]